MRATGPPGDAAHPDHEARGHGAHDAFRVADAHGAHRAAEKEKALRDRPHLDHRQHHEHAAAELAPSAKMRDAAPSAIRAARALGSAALTPASAVCALVTHTLTDTQVDAGKIAMHSFPSLVSTILTLSYILSLIGFHIF